MEDKNTIQVIDEIPTEIWKKYANVNVNKPNVRLLD
jgi:hypothetical protein